jgi:CRP-like cAMP-binding protein
VARGYTSAEIAKQIFVGVKTIETYRSRICGEARTSDAQRCDSLCRAVGSIDPGSAIRPCRLSCHAGLGRRIIDLKPEQTFFTQGDPADSVFYLQSGRAKLTVVSQNGKEATITLLSAGDFVGEESLAAVPGLRLATATASTPALRSRSAGRDDSRDA